MVIWPSGVSEMSMLWLPVGPNNCWPTGKDSSRSFGMARARSSACVMRNCTPRGCTAMPPCSTTRCSRSTRRTSSRNCVVIERIRSGLSISSSTCAPPCRSRPSETAFCGTQDGSMPNTLLRVLSFIRLGSASMQPMKVASRIRMVLTREMRIMAATASVWVGPGAARTARESCLEQALSCSSRHCRRMKSAQRSVTFGISESRS